MPAYGDVEKLLVVWLSAHVTARIGVDTPADLASVVPFVQPRRYGGADEAVPFDLADVSVDCFATSYGGARELAERVRHALRFDLPGYQATDCRVVTVTTISAPFWAPYDDTTLRRFNAAYRIRTHNPI